MAWRYLNWETDDQIDFPTPADTGVVGLLAPDGRVVRGDLTVVMEGEELVPRITFTPHEGGAFDFFDAIAWRKLS